jgi:hypothetical protein
MLGKLGWCSQLLIVASLHSPLISNFRGIQNVLKERFWKLLWS